MNNHVRFILSKLWRIKYQIRNIIKFKSIKLALISDIQGNIPKNTCFTHEGLGVVIGNSVKMGNNCIIRQHVTIGSSEKGSPIIGNNVDIYPYTVICGNCKIGDNVTIGAFSYIDKDIPSNSFVFGIPFRIVKKGGKK